MVSSENIQSVFLKEVRNRLPSNLSFADELSDILNISRDSAYRRIRGETVLSLDEVQVICNHFKISLDALLAPTTDIISFHHRYIDPDHFPFEKWLASVLDNLQMINSFPQKELTYCAKDVPIFHYYQFPELAAFKMFFWMKSYHNYRQYASEKFRPGLITKDLLMAGQKIYDLYTNIPSTEIWSDETINVTLSQINYYYESGFIDNACAIRLCDEFQAMLSQIKEFATEGSKNGKEENYKLFKNEILISETTIYFKMGDKRVAYITYNTMNILTTSQEAFCNHMEKYLVNLENKSTLISTTGEKERNKFFNQLEQRILQLKKKF